MLTGLGGAIYRTRWLVTIVSLLLIGAAAFFGTGLFGELKSGGFTDPGAQSTQAQNLLDSKLGGASADIIILMRNDNLNVTDPTFQSAATQLFTTLQARPEVSTITSYYSTHSPNLVSKDGHETFAVVQLKTQDLQQKQKDYSAIESLITSPTLQIIVGGNVPVNLAINAQISADLEDAEIITFPIVAILLFLVFNGLIAASLPLLIGGVAILGAFAVLRLLTMFTDISVYSVNVVTMLGLGLAIDYALFMVTRFREELAYDTSDTRGALQRTMATAGRTITFSGLTVSTSLLALLLFPETFLRSMGMGAIAAVMIALIGSLTLLPALLALLGRRVNALSIRGLFRRKTTTQNANSGEARGAWYRLSETVMRWPVPIALAVTGLLLLLGTPFLHVTFATPDVRVLRTDQPGRIVYERMAADFPQTGNSQLVIAIQTSGNALSSTNLANLDSYVNAIKAIPGVVRVDSLVTVNPSITLAQYQQLYAHPGTSPQLDVFAKQLANGDTTRITVSMEPAERSTGAIDIVNQIRAIHTPSGFVALVGGATPMQLDLLANLGAILPSALAVMALSIFVLLFLMTGSLVMPLKAIVLNILSLTATFGGLVWIFQDGHLQNLLNFESIGSIDATQPVLIFAIAFGLSMDYEVFLLSRIKERFDETGNNRVAVASGIERTGWLITSAAVLLAIVLGAFGTSKIIFIQEIGIGLAIAVLMDATLVRMLLVPATMRLLGKYNWWAPTPLRYAWEKIGLRETPPVVPVSNSIELPPEKEEATV